MKKLPTSELEIVIEWRCGGNHSVSREEVLALARALGRLAAQRDRERAAARDTVKRLSSAGNPATMVDVEPA